MIPVINTAVNIPPAQTALVATPLPDTNTLRVPFDNVPPPVSNAQVNNNARGNGSYAVLEPADYAVPVASSPARAAPTVSQSATSAVIPAPFLAQLVSQQVPVVLQSALGGVLAEYEKMIVSSFTKYRPSNASLPPPAPSGVYGRILHQEKSSPKVASSPQAVAAKQQPVEAVEAVTRQAAPAPSIEIEFTPSPSQIAAPAPTVAQPIVSSEPKAQAADPIVLSFSAASAYQASAARVETTAPASVTNVI